jgi:hypothetical protein
MLAFFWLARRLPTGTETQRLLAIGLGTAVFALHPSRVEAVSWISGSTDLWMCALVLLGALAFDSNRNWLAGILLALALFAKESAIVAAPLLLADRFLLRGDRDRRASVALIAPVVAALMVRVWMVDLDLPSGDAQAAAPRILASFGLYLQQVAAPWNPTAFPGMRIYSCEAGESLSASWLMMGTLLVGATTVLGIIAVRRKEWRPAFADLLWFVVPLLPVVNVLDLGSRNLTADRFLYLPMLGVVAILARGMLWLLARRPAIGGSTKRDETQRTHSRFTPSALRARSPGFETPGSSFWSARNGSQSARVCTPIRCAPPQTWVGLTPSESGPTTVRSS